MLKTFLTRVKTVAIPLLAAAIWGTAFIAQKLACHAGAFLVNGLRSLIGTLFLIILTLILSKFDFRHLFCEKTREDTKSMWLGGTLAGIALAIAAFLQQSGLNLGVDASKGGFLTALYIVLVPILGVFFGKKTPRITWFSVGLALIGLYLIASDRDFHLEFLDLMMIVCAFFYSLQILFLDRFSKNTSPTKLSMVMLLICAVISLVLSLVFEKNSIADVQADLWPILYLGVMSSGIAYTLQIVAHHKNPNPALVSVLLSMESVFSVIGGILILHETREVHQLVGCGFMLAAILLIVLFADRTLGTKRRAENE